MSAAPVDMPDSLTVRRFVAAVLFSLLVIAGGMAWTWRIGKESNRIYHALGHAEEEADSLRAMAALDGGAAR